MRLLLFIFGIAATSSALALDVRDASSDLLCMYMTDDPDWQGEAFNLCEYPGVCGKLCFLGFGQHTLTMHST